MGDNLFQLDKADVGVAENLVFPAKVPVVFYVRNAVEYAPKENKSGALLMELVVLNGEHEDKIHKMYMSKNFKQASNKKRFIEFCKAFFTDEELINGTASTASIIGQTIECVPSDPREYNGKIYQDFYQFKKLDMPAPVGEDEIPF